jgi:hypothetical protein
MIIKYLLCNSPSLYINNNGRTFTLKGRIVAEKESKKKGGERRKVKNRDILIK